MASLDSLDPAQMRVSKCCMTAQARQSAAKRGSCTQSRWTRLQGPKVLAAIFAVNTLAALSSSPNATALHISAADFHVKHSHIKPMPELLVLLGYIISSRLQMSSKDINAFAPHCTAKVSASRLCPKDTDCQLRPHGLNAGVRGPVAVLTWTEVTIMAVRVHPAACVLPAMGRFRGISSGWSRLSNATR